MMKETTIKNTKEKEKAFYSWGVARFHLNFPNGNQISTVFGEGTYSEEHDSHAFTDYLLKRTDERPVFNSATCEIMITCPDKLLKKILKKYNEGDCQPIGYLPIDKWVEIIKLISK